MIFGNPDIFAIYIDFVKEWSYPDFREGIFAYIVKNQTIPKNCFDISISLSDYLAELKLHYDSNKKNERESQYIFELDTIKAYEILDRMRFPGIGNDQVWKYSLLLGDMIDYSNELYLVTFKDKEKLFFKEKGSEFIVSLELPKDTISDVFLEAYEWYLNNLI